MSDAVIYEAIKAAAARDVEHAAKSHHADPPRDALVTNFLLTEVCDRLGKLKTYFEHTMVSQMIEIEKWKTLKPPTYRRLQEDQHDGIMVALFLDEGTAAALALPGGEDASELHCTLCYLGKVSEFTGDLEELKTTIARCAGGKEPLSGRIGGIARFTPSEHSENLSPIVALVNMPGLQDWRRYLANALDLYDIPMANDFDFLPHVTLAYIDADAPMPAQNIEALPLNFDTLWLCIGDQRIAYPLGSPDESKKAQSKQWYDGTYQYKIEALDKESVLPLGATISWESATEETPIHFKAALAGIIANEIVHFKGEDLTGRAEAGIAQLYLEAQRYAYSKAMHAVGIKVAQESIIGKVASGIKATFDQALSWAKEQVTSIASTPGDAFSNFLGGLASSLDSSEIATQTEQFLQDYASWKAPQVANYTWQSGINEGTNAAVEDILDDATDPDASVAASNIRVRVLPLDASGDECGDYAGNDYGLDEYGDIPEFPLHPNCPHYKEVYAV